MKFSLLLVLAFAVPAGAAPVHVSLKSSACVSAGTDGFLTLSQIADLSGGNKALRLRMSAVPVGRAPLSGDVRTLTLGDVTLKLRQAGFHPEQDAVLEGAKIVTVNGQDAPLAPSSQEAFPASQTLPPGAASAVPSAPLLIHRGDTVAIVVQDGDLTITTKGAAREAGAAGQTIRVHRDGVSGDLNALVLDAQTVQLEM